MNIQIFGTKKCNDTKKAERFFKERGIKYQFIDMKEKGECRPVDDMLRIDRAGRRDRAKANLHQLLRLMVALKI